MGTGGRRGRGVAALLAALVLAAGCSGDDGGTAEPPASTGAGAAVPTPGDGTCDDLDPAHCLLPWPNDRFTVADPSTPTGLRLALPAEGAPVNVEGVPVDLTDQNRADGFSPMSTVITSVPGVDLAASGVAPSTDIGASLADDAPITVTDVATGERWPYWAELDAQAPEGEQLLLVRPGRAYTEGHTYEVVVDGLVGADGTPVAADLPRTWRFTVASADSLSARMRAMVDEAGAAVPAFEVTSVEEGSPRIVRGTYEIPNFLDNDGGTGGRFALGEDGLPQVNPEHPTATVDFTCGVATSTPSPTMIFGHGLLGSREDILSLLPYAGTAGINGCATDWLGMSDQDLGTLAAILQDLSGFPAQADRMQQGQLAFHLLGRLVNDPAGFAADPAFQSADGTPLLAEDGAVFVGGSQGGILGGVVSSVTDEWDRVVLAVPGLGYNLLLTRSSNWPQYQTIVTEAYPDPQEQTIGLELIQLLWDRGENAGYAQHLTADPYPGVPAKTVLLIEAFGDHQVANVSTEILARTIGATVLDPALAPGRSPDEEPMWGIEVLDALPTTGSYLSVWDFGTPASPPANLPPSSPEYGDDPHGRVAEHLPTLLQAIGFLRTGEITDTCAGTPCQG